MLRKRCGTGWRFDSNSVIDLHKVLDNMLRERCRTGWRNDSNRFKEIADPQQELDYMLREGCGTGWRVGVNSGAPGDGLHVPRKMWGGMEN